MHFVRFAERCASWPCKQTCANIEAACPLGLLFFCRLVQTIPVCMCRTAGWTTLEDSTCAADSSYKVAGCPLVKSFEGYSTDMKLAYAEKCGVVWSC